MLNYFIQRIFARRHMWRYATFSEIAELYTSRMLRMTGNAMVGTFVAIYLYKNGYPLYFIAGYYALYYFLKACLAAPSAMFVARFGPKHGILASNIIGVPSLIAFSLLNDFGLTALVIFTICQSISMALYGIAHLVNFSKIKNDTHAGKEIGYMNIIDKLAAGLSPLMGGLIAWLISPEVTIWIASFLLLCAAFPLLRTAEPVRLRQKLDIRGFPWQQTWRSLRAEIGVGVDTATVLVIWPLFLAAVVFSTDGNVVYAEIGALSAITVFIGLIVSRFYGAIIDKKRGRELLRYTAVAKAATHFIRPFVASPVSALLTNVVNEMSAPGYAMAFMRGMFDLADRTGHRIIYLAMIESSLNIGGCLISLVFCLMLALTEGIQHSIGATFMVTGVMTLLILTARFPLYRRAA